MRKCKCPDDSGSCTYCTLNDSLTCAVQVRSKYGRDLIYPVNETAKALCALTGKRTFDTGDIRIIKQLGYDVEEVPQSLNLEAV